MIVTTSKLRSNIYKFLDQVLETGIPLEIKRKGQMLKIVPEKKKSKLDNLVEHNSIVGDPEDLVHVDWSHEWTELKNEK